MRNILLFALLCLGVFSCNNKYPIDELPPDINPPSLTNPMAGFASLQKFVPFGGMLSTSETCKGYFFHVTDTNQSVVSACSGVVVSVTNNLDNNNTVLVKYKSNSIYSVQYSGVRDVIVAVNMNIAPGTVLGKVCDAGDVSIVLIKNSNEALCPEQFGSPGFNTSVQQAIARHNMLNPTDSVFNSCNGVSLPL